MAWGVNGLTFATLDGLALDGEEAKRDGSGQDEGNKSPSLSNLNLARLRLFLATADEERCRREKEDDKVQAWVGDKSRSMSREQVGEAG